MYALKKMYASLTEGSRGIILAFINNYRHA